MKLEGILFVLFLLTLLNTLQLRRLARETRRLLMASKADFDQKLDTLSASLDNVSGDVDALQAEIQALKDQVANGGLTPDEETAVLARIDELQAKADAAANKVP
jgi:uncharacterized coiled-coil DUF342 family protein